MTALAIPETVALSSSCQIPPTAAQSQLTRHRHIMRIEGTQRVIRNLDTDKVVMTAPAAVMSAADMQRWLDDLNLPRQAPADLRDQALAIGDQVKRSPIQREIGTITGVERFDDELNAYIMRIDWGPKSKRQIFHPDRRLWRVGP